MIAGPTFGFGFVISHGRIQISQHWMKIIHAKVNQSVSLLLQQDTKYGPVIDQGHQVQTNDKPAIHST